MAVAARPLEGPEEGRDVPESDPEEAPRGLARLFSGKSAHRFLDVAGPETLEATVAGFTAIASSAGRPTKRLADRKSSETYILMTTQLR